MRSTFLLMLVTMGLVLVIGMSVKKYNYDHDTYYSPWQLMQEKVQILVSSK